MRIVIHERTGPYKIRIRDIEGAESADPNSRLLDMTVELCACGLSHNKPFCDGSHESTEDEGLEGTYAYNENNERVVLPKIYKPDGKI